MRPAERSVALDLLARAIQLHRDGQLAEAEHLYREVLDAYPDHADALHLSGVLAMQTGRNELAVELIRKALQRNTARSEFHDSLGNALQRLGRYEEAAVSYRQALAIEPGSATTYYNLAVALQMQGRLEEAAQACAQTLKLNPDFVEAHCLLGTARQLQGQLEEAVDSYRQALLRRPSYPEGHYKLGTALQAQGKLDEAAASYRQVLALMPDCAEAFCNLGTILFSQGKTDEATANFKRALALKPDYATARLGLAMSSIPIFADTVEQSAGTTGRFLRALDDLAAWNNAHPGVLGRAVGTSQPYHLLYRRQDITAPMIQYGKLVCAASASCWQLPPERFVPPPRERIRIVVVCGFVHQRHPVWNIVLRGFVAHLDRQLFEIVLYHTGLTVDGETDWAKDHVDRFVQGPKTTKAWLDEMARDRPDVVFYPEVGMDCATCALAALRLAPLQVVGQGNAMTTGFPTIDIYFSGEHMEGPGADRHYSEKLVRLPGTGLCLDWMNAKAEPWSGPDRPTNTVRFALWLQPIKFDPEDDVLFARIAKAAAPCEFWLVRPQHLAWTGDRLRDRMASAFRAEGLDPEAYLRVGSWLTLGQLSGLFDAVDVYLDSPAFSGCTTAWQAIHRGLPIVALEGEFLRQRQTSGLLRQIGITDTIASTRDEYVETAVLLAREWRTPATYAARRDSIRRAAAKLEGDISVVRAFEKTLIDTLRERARTDYSP